MPEIGRFAGRDIVKGTILEPLTLNNYHYCYGNPNKYVDLDGRTPMDALKVVYNMTDGNINEMANIAALYGYVKITGDITCTFASTITRSGSVSIGVSRSKGYAIDGQWNMERKRSNEIQLSTGPAVFVGKSYSFSDAPNLQKWTDYRARGMDFSAGESLSVSGGLRVGYDDENGLKNIYNEYNMSVGLGVSALPFMGDVANTSTDPIEGTEVNLYKIWHKKKDSLD